MNEPLLTISQLSELLNVKPQTIRSLCRQDKVPHLRLGNRYRFVKQAVLDYLQVKEKK